MGEINVSKWNTSVNELLLNFKGALDSLLPWLIKSKIPINEGEAYDDWEAITSALFESMVINSIRFSEEYEGETIDFSKYDFQYENYTGLVFIIAENPKDSDELTVFVSFDITDNFEMINVCKISRTSLKSISRDKIRLSDAEFFLIKEILIDKLVIET